MRTSKRLGRLAAVVGAVGAAWLLPACEVPPRLSVVVDHAGTAPDADPGDGVCEATAGAGDCTLRAAIEETNATATDDVLTIAPGVSPSPGGSVPITGTLGIHGNGATLRERLVHEAGSLTVENLTITGATTATTCGGGIASTGHQLALHRVTVTSNRTTDDAGGGVCATGRLIMADSTISGNQVDGPASAGAGVTASGPVAIARTVIEANRRSSTGGLVNQVLVIGDGEVHIAGSFVDASTTAAIKPESLIALSASGRITGSRLAGTLAANPTVIVAGSLVQGSCAAGSAPGSGGYNRYTGAGCPVTATDAVIASANIRSNGVPEIWSPLLEAIPVGTADLCPGPLAADRFGTVRPVNGACDIGDVEVPGRVRSTRPANPAPSLGGDIVAVNDDGAMAGWIWSPLEQPPYYPPAQAQPVAWTAAGIEFSLDGVRPVGVGPDDTVLGSRVTPSGHEAATVQPGGAAVGLGTLPGDTTSVANAAAAGWIVGDSGAPGAQRPWVHTAEGGMVELPTLAGTGHVVDVNASGLAVGSSTDAGGVERAVLWDLEAGTVTEIGTATAHATRAESIGEDGDVVGTIDRPDVPETCSNPVYGIPACPSSQPFTWTFDTGAFTPIPGADGPRQGVGFGPGGTVVVTETRYRYLCDACPTSLSTTDVYDPTTGTTTRLAVAAARDVSAEGVVVGNRLAATLSGTYDEGTYLRVWLAD